MSRLLAYTIGGQKIGIDIKSWNAAMLSGNTAFMIFANTGTLPTNYTDISSVDNWDNFGNAAGQTEAFIKDEIIKLIPGTPTEAQFRVLEKYINVGINGVTKIGDTTMFGDVITGTTSLTGTSDSIIYGTEYQKYEALASTTMSNTSAMPKIATLFDVTKAGTYKITASWVWSRSSTNASTYFSMTVNGAAQGTRPTLTYRVSNTADLRAASRIIYITLTAGQHTVTLNCWNSAGSTTISDAVIEIIRVA
jgi:hypothetical protein